jgi:hypothetical protein
MELDLVIRHRPHHPTPTRHRIATILLLMMGMATRASAADVDFRFSSLDAWVGASISVEVEIVNAENVSTPELPVVDGASIRLLPGERTSSFTQIVNGRMTTRRTSIHTIEIRPQREGEIEIPPIVVDVDGERFASEPTTVVARRSETGDLLLVQVAADPTEVFVGESLDATLRIVIRPYRSTEFGVELDEEDMWSLIDLEACEFGAFQRELEAMLQQRRRPRGRPVEVGDRTYFVYDLPATLQALRVGTPDLGDISIVMRYPTSLRASRDFFGRRDLALGGVRPLVATPTLEGIEVLPLPTEGRPAWFTGAVGNFEITASATPTSISVGDPVTLSLSVRDLAGADGDLGLLQGPPLGEVPNLDSGFRFPSEPMTGVVAGRTKTFTQTIRPLTEAVTEVPPIPFSWFDPSERVYRTAWTEPIPITVQPTETMSLSQVVQADGAAPRSRLAGGLDGTSTDEDRLGLRANVPVSDALLRDGVIALDWRLGGVVAVPPVLALLTVAYLRRRRLLAENPDLARASRARRTALRRLAPGDADAVAAAITGFVADRARRPGATITRQEVRTILDLKQAPPELADRVDRILEACERARFTGGSLADSDTVAGARQCLAKLDRLRWTRSRTVRQRGVA